MKPLEVKAARTRLGYTQQYMAGQLKLTINSYQKKESGRCKFTDEEKIKLARILKLTFEQLDEYLFDGELKFFLPDSCQTANYNIQPV